MAERITSLTVGTEGAEEWFRLFEQLSVLANKLGSTHHHVSVSSTVVGDDDLPDENREVLYYDEYTLLKVRDAIKKNGLKDEIADQIINNLLNAGILFRERVRG